MRRTHHHLLSLKPVHLHRSMQHITPETISDGSTNVNVPVLDGQAF